MLTEICQLIVRDNVNSWYQPVAGPDPDLGAHASALMLRVVDELQRRFEATDMLMFLTQDVVRIFTFHVQSLAKSSLGHFPSHPCLRSADSERAYLGQVADVLLHFLVPKDELLLPTVRDIARTMLVENVLYNTVQFFCDPDYLNQYIVYRCDVVNEEFSRSDQSYRYAPTFDKFMEIIRTCQSVDQLKDIRYHVIAEIVQAAHIEKCKQMVSRGGPAARAALAMLSESEKSTTLSNRNLVRYCNQCAQAKAECERRITLLGGPDYRTMNVAMQGAAPASMHGTALGLSEKVLRLSEILSDGLALSYFCQYLQKFHDEINLKFWLSCQGMRVVCCPMLCVLCAHHAIRSWTKKAALTRGSRTTFSRCTTAVPLCSFCRRYPLLVCACSRG